MNAVLFDTLAFARRMEAAGFTREQAEALAEEQAKLLDERLATKADIERVHADIDALRQETKADIETLRQETKAGIETMRQETKTGIETLGLRNRADIAEVRWEVVKWTIGAIGVQTVVIVSAVIALARSLLH